MENTDGAMPSWHKDEALKDWPRAMETARMQLATSSTKKRVEFLQEELLPLAKHGELSLSQNLDIFKLLTHTYPRYIDAGSREAVEAVGMAIVARDESSSSKAGIAEQIIGWLSHEVGRIARKGQPSATYASADMFVLLSWCCGIYEVCAKENEDFSQARIWPVLLGLIATLVDLLLNPTSSAKPALRKSVLVRTRRALRSSPQNLDKVLATLLSQAKSSSNPLSLIPLIGIAIGVTTHLKNVKAGAALDQVSAETKDGILGLYSSHIIMARTHVSPHVLSSLHDFISTCITPDDLKTAILPTAEKGLLRSPEYALEVINSFFRSYSHELDTPAFTSLLKPILSASKSSSAPTRASSVTTFGTLCQKLPSDTSGDDARKLAVDELLSLPKTGKASSVEHRLALYSMLPSLPPSSLVSPVIVQTLPQLIAKETHDAALVALSVALGPQLGFLLKNDIAVPKDIVAAFTKELAGTKPPIRRAFASALGTALWETGSDAFKQTETQAFVKSVVPALEGSLKGVSAAPGAAASGLLEGYISVAVLLGVVSKAGLYDPSSNPNLTALPNTTKPSFLFLDRIYTKLTNPEDETWLLRAIEAAFSYLIQSLSKSDQLRTLIGGALVHLATQDGVAPPIRRSALRVCETLSATFPQEANMVLRDAIISAISRSAKPTTKTTVSEEEGNETSSKEVNVRARLAGLLYTCANFDESVPVETKQELLADLVILGHHPAISDKSRQTWIDLCQKARSDPRELVDAQLDRLLKLVLAASNSTAKGFAEASYNAVRTLVFVSPTNVLPRVMEQLLADINSVEINGLSELELGVWLTPEGTTYIDPLASAKTDNPAQKKGKDRDLALFDAEVRKSLAAKKGAGTPQLTKQQQALVQAQLDKEAEIRSKVLRVKANLERGLHFIRSIAEAGVDEMRTYMGSIAALLVKGALGKGPQLVGDLALRTYLDLSNCCSPRLGTLREWIGVATLRSLGVNGVTEDYQVEALGSLVTRVLYRLRTLSEEAPFDPSTYAYTAPLLNEVLLKAGIGIGAEEDPGEQIILVLDIITFHAAEFSNGSFPRSSTILSLLAIIASQPRYGKDASAALVDIGEAMHESATEEESALLLNKTLSQEVYVRHACLQTLQPFDLTELDWSPELLLATNDEDEQNARLAQHLWDDNGLDVPETFLDTLMPYLEHDNAYVRGAAAKAFSVAVDHWPQSIGSIVTALEDFYREKAKILAPEFDQYGMIIESSLGRSDPWPARVAIGKTFELLAPAFSPEMVESFIAFLIKDEALGDRSGDVRPAMLNAAVAVIDIHGKDRLAPIMSLFENKLAAPSAGTDTDDYIKEASVILLGRAARHLSPTDKRIPVVVDRLVESLKTPSEQVQIAVSDCLAPLVALQKEHAAKLVNHLLDELFTAPKYAARRGAAYGLAGAIKGLGISFMKEYDILARLKRAAEEKKQYESRQGAMFAIETMSNTLRRLFEPYVIHILPTLLSAFGDSVPEVREAAQEAARAIMANMSGYGVKTVLPDLLSGLEEKQWRTKRGSIELLGMMAYCAPRQLSQSLPIVIPQLTGVLTDSHAQVRASADRSLKQFGEVISNPEIQTLVPVLLKALVDPERTPRALTSLLKTSFMHYIDHSSLALVIPIIERGLKERGADTKKKAARIVGNLASLTEAKDFVPYLPRLLPMIHVVLVDPVPEARATAAKSLGALVERLGEVHFPDLVPGLIRTLKTDTSGVDRQGAAQGLSEVLSGLGMERMEGLLPDIIVNAQSPRSTVREGFMSLLVYLPATFGARFQPHLPKIITPILSGLSDQEEYVREAAMRAGRMIVTNYSSRAIDLLLPELERGMFDPGWRIRQSSITLVGELLFKVSGISGKAEIEEEEETVEESAQADSSKRALAEVLGVERRDRILAALYLSRQDSVNVVRQSSVHIWKALVSNTPRTVREILPELVGQVILLLSSSEDEQQETASRTMGELCRKSGEKVLTEILNILRTKSTSQDARVREGVALAVSEVVENTTETQREDHEDEIVAMVRTALIDEDATVRGAAAKAFDVLQEYVGPRAIDQTIPTLLDALRQPGASSGTALKALKEVMNVRASTVFPVLIPTLTASPMTLFNARALGTLVTVAGNALSKRLTVILNALVKEQEGFTGEEDSELPEAIDEAIRALLSSISDPEGLNTLMLHLLGWVKSETPKRRVSGCNLFATFCEVSELEDSIYRVDWIRALVSLLDDRQPEVHKAAWAALESFVKSLPKDELEPLAVPLRRTIEGTGAPGQYVPGFSLPKGVSPMVPIIIAGLTTGSNEQREQAAYAIGDLVERTEESAIKPFVVPFTGPLIRVATQATAYPPGVKTAILTALKTMLERIPAFVKPFFPQLQRTFVKSAGDPSSLVVRTRAAEALGVLMKNQPRVDPVVTELVTATSSSEEEVAGSYVLSLAYVVRNGGANVGDKAREACVELVSNAFKEAHHDHFIQATANLFAALSSKPESVEPIVETYLVADTAPSALGSHCVLAVLSDEDHEGPNVFQQLGLLKSVAQKIQASIGSDRPAVARPAREAKDLLRNLHDPELAGVV